MKKLTEKEEAFCQAYIVQQTVKNSGKPHTFGNATASYEAVFDCSAMKKSTIRSRASALLKQDFIKARVSKLRAYTFKKTIMEAQDVLREWIDIATADPCELIHTRRTCCRFCHGNNHQRQWVKSEYDAIVAKLISEGRMPVEAPGGFGFNATLDPHPSCPVCFGEGIEGVYVADTRKLTGKARKLYGGLRKTRSGIEIIFRNQDAALENIARYLGMFKDKDATPPPAQQLGPIGVVTTDPVTAAKIYKQIMQGD